MKISDSFPSKFLRAVDLQGRTITVTIDRVEREEMNDGKIKPVVYFVGKLKGVALNKTNAMIIATLYGDETKDWTDHEIVLFSGKVPFQGRIVDAIQVGAPQPKDRQRPTNGSQQRPPQRREDPISSGPSARDEFASGLPDDEIPF